MELGNGSSESDLFIRLQTHNYTLDCGLSQGDTTWWPREFIDGLNVPISSEIELASFLQDSSNKHSFQLVSLRDYFPSVTVSLSSIKHLYL